MGLGSRGERTVLPGWSLRPVRAHPPALLAPSLDPPPCSLCSLASAQPGVLGCCEDSRLLGCAGSPPSAPGEVLEAPEGCPSCLGSPHGQAEAWRATGLPGVPGPSR